jgi:hypothetical protein
VDGEAYPRHQRAAGWKILCLQLDAIPVSFWAAANTYYIYRVGDGGGFLLGTGFLGILGVY